MEGIHFHPLTPEQWQNFVQLFGSKGACGGCWCMYWKLGHQEFKSRQGTANQLAQKAIVESGIVPGILAFKDDTPVGWIAVEPRSAYATLARSRILKPLDEVPVWSVTCFFVARNYRRRGITIQLLHAAVDFARSKGGKVVEGYPIAPHENKKYPAAFAYTGLVSAYLQAGFHEAGRRSLTRPIMRRNLE